MRTRIAATRAVAGLAAAAAMGSAARAQVQHEVANVSPVYEGWERNPDGTFNLVFGYFNRSWDHMPLVPIGPDNNLSPGPAEQGQPTYFMPRRNHFIFRIAVPADFGSREVVWTLRTLGREEKAYGTLKPDYVIDDIIMMSNIGAGGALSITPDMVGNKAPVIALEGSRSRTVRAGEPLPLVAVATDDDKPNPRNMPPVLGRDYSLPNSAKGLRFAWFVYRGGARHVAFDPPQHKVWEDTRDGGHSPWSAGWVNPRIPPGNRWAATATFSQPGTYTIRGIAHDGGLSSTAEIVVTVTP